MLTSLAGNCKKRYNINIKTGSAATLGFWGYSTIESEKVKEGSDIRFIVVLKYPTLTAEFYLMSFTTQRVGPLRDGERLGIFLDGLNRLKRAHPAVSRAGNIIIAHLIALAARRRRENRGAYFRRDFPSPDPAQA